MLIILKSKRSLKRKAAERWSSQKLLEAAKRGKDADEIKWHDVKLIRTIDNAHDGEVACLKVLDEKRIISGGGDDDPTIKIWDRESWRCLQRLIGHGGGVTALKRLGQNKLISGSLDNINNIMI
jgi:WD40 repeat protein